LNTPDVGSPLFLIATAPENFWLSTTIRALVIAAFAFPHSIGRLALKPSSAFVKVMTTKLL
jgi:hypothetical protein